MSVFNKLTFHIDEETFYMLLKNPDKGFGFKAEIMNDSLTLIQKETFHFLAICYTKGLLGSIELKFKTEAIGEINSIRRMVEKVEGIDDGYIISNSY